MHREQLDGRLCSALRWAPRNEDAQSTLWQLDLGLFHELPQPLEDQAQFRSLALVLQEFRSSVWKSGQDIGVCLYSGPADYPSLPSHVHAGEWLAERKLSALDPRTAQLFRRDVCVEYIDLLTTQLPEELDAYVELDVSPVHEPLQRLRLLAPDRYEHLKLIVHGLPEHIVWDLSREELPPLGVLIPERDCVAESAVLSQRLSELDAAGQPYRVIAEPLLTMSWAELDQVIVDPSLISLTGKRQLEGFAAAGGEILELG